MLKSIRPLVVLALCSAASISAASTASAASVKTQGPCTYTGGVCATFDFNDDIPTISTYKFSAPAGATAVVMFDGTMQCVVQSNVSTLNVVDLAAQIVTNASGVADYTGPGGARYSMRLNFGTDLLAPGPSTTFNLAATRSIKFVEAGNKTVYYKFNRLRMDTSTVCSVTAASFTVIITP